jgi:hypothetical protein
MDLRETTRQKIDLGGQPAMYLEYEGTIHSDSAKCRVVLVRNKEKRAIIVTMISSPEQFESDHEALKRVLSTFSFSTNEGDNIANAPREHSESTSDLRGRWEGTFEQYVPSKSYPMRLEVSGVSGGNFNGVLHWPTLRDSKTTISGEQKGEDLVWTEDSLLQGRGVLLHGNYKASVTGADSIEGKCYHSSLGRGAVGSFVLRRVRE